MKSTFIKGHRRPGYLLERESGDVRHALYCALYDVRDNQLQSVHVSTPEPVHAPVEERQSTTIKELNSLLHEQASQWNDQGSASESLATVDLDKTIKRTNPQLWRMVWSMTSAKKHLAQSDTEADKVRAGQLNHCRRFPCLFILSVMTHLVQPRCHFPLSLALADYIDSHSNSTDLIRLLSRLGVCSSRDSHQRLKTAVVLDRHDHGIENDLSLDAFAVTSIDNIDWSAPGKRICVTDQDHNRGFHGTSIQQVSPMPISCKLSAAEVPDQPVATTISAGLFTPIFQATSTNRHPRTIQEGVKRLLAQGPTAQNASPALLPTLTAPEAAITDDQHDRLRLQWFRPPRATVRPLAIQAVRISREEDEAAKNMDSRIHAYMVKRVRGEKMPGLKDSLVASFPSQHCERSLTATVGILPDSVENTDTVKSILDRLHSLYKIGSRADYHVVVGDRKVFSTLQKLKKQYGTELDWLKPYPGDWHWLKNFQPVLMKVYFHVGLKDLAEQAGYKGSNLTALQTCSNFKHTHVFLLEVFEALYLHVLKLVSKKNNVNEADVSKAGVHRFLKENCTQHTSLLWTNLLLRDLASYIRLWLAVRTGDWLLRCASVKGMSPLFAALDRRNYAEVSAVHLADIWQYPQPLLDHFKRGAFAVSMRGTAGRSQAMDEAHETVINRKTKAVLNRADANYIETNAHYLPFRADLQQNLVQQIIGEDDESKLASTAAQPANVAAMLSKLTSSSPFEVSQKVSNVFTGKTATQEEEHGMLMCHKIGTEKIECFFEGRIMHAPSVDAPVRMQRLRFMGEKKHRPPVKKIKSQKQMILVLKAQLLAAQTAESTPGRWSALFIAPSSFDRWPQPSTQGTKSESSPCPHEEVSKSILRNHTPSTVGIEAGRRRHTGCHVHPAISPAVTSSHICRLHLLLDVEMGFAHVRPCRPRSPNIWRPWTPRSQSKGCRAKSPRCSCWAGARRVSLPCLDTDEWVPQTVRLETYSCVQRLQARCCTRHCLG